MAIRMCVQVMCSTHDFYDHYSEYSVILNCNKDCYVIIYKSWLRGVFCVYMTQTEARGSLQCICPANMRCKRLKAEVLGSYIRGIHHVTMIHVICYHLVQRRHFFYELV